jgi:alanyl-tRNA synthetase
MEKYSTPTPLDILLQRVPIEFKEFSKMTEIRKERLYYNHSDLFEFEANVVEQIEQEDGKWLVRLDKTAFYPTSGGQPHDTGWLNESRVQDVVIVDEHVYHIVDSPCVAETKLKSNAAGGPADSTTAINSTAISSTAGNSIAVVGKIDVPRRVDHMQQHAGQHIVSACFEQLFNIDTVGFHLGEELVTIDLDTSNLTDEILLAAEEKANQIVLEDRKIMPVFVAPEDIPALQLRHAPKVSENIRIVQIEGFDNNPCGGTHPSSTGKVGQIKFLKTEKVRTGVRLYFVCGNRALQEHRESYKVIQQLGKVFSAGRVELVEAVEKQLAASQELKKQNAELVNRLATLEAKELYALSERRKDGSLVYIAKVQSPGDSSYLKSIIKAYESGAALQAQSFVLAVIAPIGNRIFIQAACSDSVSLSAKDWIVPVILKFGGKGGGNGGTAQGSVPVPAVGDADKLVRKMMESLQTSIVHL